MLDFGLARQYLISTNQANNSTRGNNSLIGKDENVKFEVRPPRTTAGKLRIYLQIMNFEFLTLNLINLIYVYEKYRFSWYRSLCICERA